MTDGQLVVPLGLKHIEMLATVFLMSNDICSDPCSLLKTNPAASNRLESCWGSAAAAWRGRGEKKRGGGGGIGKWFGFYG